MMKIDRLPVRRSLCQKCSKRFRNGLEVQDVSAARYDKCDECEKKSIVNDVNIRKKVAKSGE